MTEWLYLAFGFALFFVLSERKGKQKGTVPGDCPFKNVIALTALVAVDLLSTHFLWRPAGRMDLRFISLFFWALLIDGGRERQFVPLIGFSLWMITREETLSLPLRLTGGLMLPLVTGILKGLLESSLKRLRLADIPGVLEGAPVLFCLASLLALASQGLTNLARLFVN